MTLALKSGKIRLDLYGIVIGYVSGVCGGGSARLTISSKFDPPHATASTWQQLERVPSVQRRQA